LPPPSQTKLFLYFMCMFSLDKPLCDKKVFHSKTILPVIFYSVNQYHL
jgi:hypothetical protein